MSASAVLPTTRRKVLTDMRRQEILAAAIKVFGRRGFAATRAEDIAAAANIAKGTLYLYFSSKEEIYTTAAQVAAGQLQDLADERMKSANGVSDRLAVAISVRLEFWHEQRSLYRLLLTVGREPRHKRQTHELLRSGHRHFLKILKDGGHANELRKQDFAAIAWSILDMIRGCSERRMDDLSDSTPLEDATRITAFALHQLGLRPQAGALG